MVYFNFNFLILGDIITRSLIQVKEHCFRLQENPASLLTNFLPPNHPLDCCNLTIDLTFRRNSLTFLAVLICYFWPYFQMFLVFLPALIVFKVNAGQELCFVVMGKRITDVCLYCMNCQLLGFICNQV